MFEIIDHRKNKQSPQWVVMYIAQIRAYLEPTVMFGEVEYPTIGTIYYTTNSIIEKLKEIRSHSRQGISPIVQLDTENESIRLLNSLNTLVLEIRKTKKD